MEAKREKLVLWGQRALSCGMLWKVNYLVA